MALDIDAVSPFLSASNIRNFLTDCSIDAPLSCAVAAVPDRGAWKLELDCTFISPAVPVNGFGPWPPECWCDILEVVDGVWAGWVLKEAVSILLLSPSLSLRRNRVKVDREDLLRLWLRSGIVSTTERGIRGGAQ